MRYGSVCSGIGGCAAAWHPLGWETAFFAEIEPFPSAVLKHHYASVPNAGDFTSIKGDEYGPIELLVGGTPCQSFSVAGLRGGLSDDRGNLALEFLRLAGRTRARWVVWENVPGVLSSESGRDFGCILGGLAELGYGFAYRILDAQYFGVPQRRRRVFVVGHLGDWRAAAAVLFERHSLQGDSAPSRKSGERVAGTIKGGSGERGYPDPSDGNGGGLIGIGIGGEDIGYSLRATPSHSGDKGDGGVNCTLIAGSTDVARTLMAKHTRHDPELESYVMTLGHTESNGLGIYESETANTLEAVSSSNQAVTVPTLVSEGDAHSGFRDEHGLVTAFAENCRSEIREMDVMPALATGGGKPGVGYPAIAFQPRFMRTTGGQPQEELNHALSASAGGGDSVPHIQRGMAVRRLTPRECERLQGYRDDYTLIPYRGKPATDGPRYKALGNSWAVPVVQWIGKRIEQVDSVNP